MPHNFLEHLGTIDVIAIGVVFFSGFYGLLRGLSAEIMSLILWGLSAFLAIRGRGMIFAQMGGEKIAPLWSVGLPLMLFVIIMIILRYATRTLSHWGRDILSASLDAVLGGGFGLIRGALLIILGALFFSWSAQDWFFMAMKQSVFAPYIYLGMKFMAGDIFPYLSAQTI